MPRYLTKPRNVHESYDDEGELCITGSEVIIEDDEPEFTGLYDHNGYEICRDRDRVRFGFVPGTEEG